MTGRPKRIIVHHTATVNTPDVSRSRAFALARAIQVHHMDTFGWIDTGQHFTVSRGAYVLEGREGSLASLYDEGGPMVVGTHCSGQNALAIGIETEGTYIHREPPVKQYEALVDLCARICRQYWLSASEIYGHRDFNATQCPGDALYALLPQLRRDVGSRIADDDVDADTVTDGESQRARHAVMAEAGEDPWEELYSSALQLGGLWSELR
ncbi:N-acetylmuramoyl-L-alanine amidase [Streptomyces sp. ISL-44]|nr:N-acetylmuramoyl-L-alanine amidase [Streptomyces sp. ISL-44]